MRYFKPGETVYFHGDSPTEDDRGEVVHAYRGVLRVRWIEAGEVLDEDPDDERISRQPNWRRPDKTGEVF